LRDRAFCDI